MGLQGRKIHRKVKKGECQMNLFLSLYQKKAKIETKTYEANHILFQEGDECLGLYHIKEGQGIIKNIFFDGNESIIRYINPGDVIGDILLFSNHAHFPATIIAKTKLTLEFIKKNDLVEIIKNDSEIAFLLLNKISSQAFALNNRVKLLSKKSIRSKICYYLLNISKEKNSLTFTLDYNKEQWADILNIERPSLSRELIKLKNEGIIDYYSKTIKIIDIDKLKEYV